MDEQAQARADLAAIRRLMEGGQRAVDQGGPYYLVWGVLMAAALVATYLLIAQGALHLIPWIWGAAVGSGWIVSLLLMRVLERRARVHSTAGRMLGGLWLGTGITMTLLGFLGPAGGGVASGALTGILSGVLGGAYFATGTLAGSPWLRAAGVAWWAGAAILLLWPGVHGLLLMAGLLVVLQAVPGAYFLARARRAVHLA